MAVDIDVLTSACFTPFPAIALMLDGVETIPKWRVTYTVDNSIQCILEARVMVDGNAPPNVELANTPTMYVVHDGLQKHDSLAVATAIASGR
jgi:hypothetical protein